MVFVSFLSAVVLSINVSNGVKTKSRALIASWQGKQVFEHYLVGRFAVVFVKFTESPAAGRGVFFFESLTMRESL